MALHIPQEFADKIRFLCKSIPKHEWSGVLFYEIEGTIKDVEKMKITLKDILLMNKGTATFTSFDWDEDVVNYQMDNPEAMEWKIGHIHSHNTMNVFFSGTDWEELNDNCPQHNLYLSVIVNNYLDIAAKVAFTAESQVFICKDENGKDYTLKLSNADIKPMMFVYDCETFLPEKEVKVSDSFADRYKAIEKKAAIEAERKAEEARKKAAEDAAKAVKNPVVKGDFWGDGMSSKSKFPDYNPKSKGHQSKSLSQYIEESYAEEIDDDDVTNFTQQTIEQEFATYVLRLGNDELEDDELVDALEDIEASNLNALSLSASILQSYGAYYERFFDRYSRYQGDKAFMEVLEEVISIYEGFEDDYKFLDPVVRGLKELGIKFENFQKEQV